MGARLFCNSMPLYMLFRLGEIPFAGLLYLENSYAIYYKTGLKGPGSEAWGCLPVMVPVCPSSTSTRPHRLCFMHQETPMPPDFSPDSTKESHQGENKRQDEEESWIVMPRFPSCDRACISPWPYIHGSSYFWEQ